MDQLYFEQGYLEDGYYTIIREAELALTVTATATAAVSIADATGYYIPDYIEVDYFVGGGALIDATGSWSSEFQVAGTIGKLIVINSEMVSESTQTASAGRILEAAAEFTSAFSPTLTADAFKNSTAILDVVADFLVDAVANRSANVLLEHIADLNAMAAKTVDVTSSMAASTTVTSSANLQLQTSAALNSEFTVTAQGGFLKQTASALQTTSTVLVLSRILLRNTTVTVNSGSRFDPIIFDDSVKKFGSHSAFFGDSTPDLFPTVTELGNTQIISNGTTFYIIKDDNTWTSNDGLSWTRTANNLTAIIREVTYTNGQFIAFQSNSTVIWYSSDAITWSSSNTFPNTLSQRSGVVFFNGLYRVVGLEVRNNTWRINSVSASSLTGSWSTSEIINTNAGDVNFRTRNHSNYIVWGYNSGLSSNVVVGRHSAASVGFNLYSSSPPGRRLLALDHDGANSWSAVLSGTGISNYVRSTSNNGSTYNETTLANANGIDFANGRWFVRTSTEIRTNTVVHPLGSAVQLNTQSTNQIRATSSAWITWDPYRPANVLVSSNGSTWATQEITNVSGVPANIVYTRGDNSDLSNFATVDFWLRTIHNDSKTLLTFQGQGFDPVIMRATSTIFGPGVGAGFTALSTNTWHHVRISRSGSTTSTYLNGQRFGTTTLTVWPSNAELRIGHSNGFYIDELLVSDQLLTDPSVTSFTVPSVPWTQNSNTDLLVHFDNSFADDSKFDPVAAAALAASFTVTAAVDGNLKIASAAVNSTVTVAATANKLIEANADISSTSTLTVAVNRTRSAASDLNSNASIDATIGSIKQFDIEVNALFTPNFDADVQLAGVALLESAFEQTAQAVKTADVVSEQQVIAELTTTSTVTVGVSADFSTTSATSINGERLRFGSSDLSTVADLNIDFLKLRPATADLSSAVTVIADADRFRTTQIATDVQSTVTANVDRFRLTTGDFSVDTEVTVTATRIQEVTVQLSAEFQQNTNAIKDTDIVANAVAEVTQTTTAVKTVDALPQLESIATQLTAAFKNASGTITLESQATVTAFAGTIKEYAPKINRGVRALNAVPRITLSGLGTFGLNIRDAGFTASIWVKRETAGNVFQTIWMPWVGDSLAVFPTYKTGLVFDNTNIRLRSQFDADEPGATWNNAAPMDTEWHNIVVWAGYNIANSNPSSTWHLWVDGDYQGSANYSATMQGNVFINSNTSGDPKNYAQFGTGIGVYPVSGYDVSQTTNNDISVAQAWFGVINQPIYRFPINEFYDGGYRDLGTNGRGSLNVLPQPLIYSLLNQGESTFYVTPSTTAPGPSSESITVPGPQASTSLTAQPQAVLVTVGSWTSTTTVTALGSFRIDNAAELVATSSQTVSATTAIGILADLVTEAEITATVFRQQLGAAALTSTATLAAIVGATEQFDSALSAAFELQADFDVKPPVRAEAALTAEFSLVSDPNSFSDNTALIMTVGDLVCEITVIPPIRIEADLVSQFTVTATIGAIEQFAVLTVSSGTLNCSPTAEFSGFGSLSTVTEQTTAADRFLGISNLVLQSNGFQLTAGDAINIDPFLQLKITQETRRVKILPESRTLNIEQETRTLLIKGHP